MKLFISWSGKLSKDIGEEFRKWIPGVIQTVKPYFTPDDVEKGTRWANEISKELEGSQMGILVLTRENLDSMWIMFEAGALSKQMDKSRICPILFGIENTDMQGPLVQFQATNFNETDIRKLIEAINSCCEENKLEEPVLEEVFNLWWPRLEKEISKIMETHKEKADETLRSDRELIEEILTLSRIGAVKGEPRIHPGAVEDLMRTYSRLRHSARAEGNEKLYPLVKSMAAPIEYLAEHVGVRRRAWRPIEERIRRIRPTVEIEELESREVKEEEEEEE